MPAQGMHCTPVDIMMYSSCLLPFHGVTISSWSSNTPPSIQFCTIVLIDRTGNWNIVWAEAHVMLTKHIGVPKLLEFVPLWVVVYRLDLQLRILRYGEPIWFCAFVSYSEYTCAPTRSIEIEITPSGLGNFTKPFHVIHFSARCILKL